MGIRALRLAVAALSLGIIVSFGEVSAFMPFFDADVKTFYGHYGQTGPNGFFGPYDVDNSGTGDFAPLNGWVGGNSDVNTFATGTNAAVNSTGFWAMPGVTAWNSRVQATYQLNVYDVGTAEGTNVAISPGQWTGYYLSVPTPYARVRYGKTDFFKGNKFQFGGDRSMEYLLVESRWGVHWVEVWDQGKLVATRSVHPDTRLPSPEDFDQMSAEDQAKTALEWGFVDDEMEPNVKELRDFITIKDGGYRGSLALTYAEDYYSPQFALGFGFFPWVQPSTNAYFNQKDLNAVTALNLLLYLDYVGTYARIGLGGTMIRFRIGPESQKTTIFRQNFSSTDTVITEGWIYCNFSQGNIWLNTEVDWYNETVRFQRSLTGLFGNETPLNPQPGTYTDGSFRSRFAPKYIESWRYMIEAGTLWGPTMARLLYAFIPGQDRRHGIAIDRQPGLNRRNQSSATVFAPYNMLLGNIYLAGLASSGGLQDASTIAVRLDHAIAANLNVFLSFLTAYRTSNGYGWGFIRPDPNPASFGKADFAIRGEFGSPSPAIPDNHLGWEIGAGLKWQLLENFIVDFRASYWKPGRWFNFACIDRSVLDWDTPSVANNFGINPNRTIDPVFGVELTFGAGI